MSDIVIKNMVVNSMKLSSIAINYVDNIPSKTWNYVEQ